VFTAFTSVRHLSERAYATVKNASTRASLILVFIASNPFSRFRFVLKRWLH